MKLVIGLLMFGIAAFAYCACVVSSECDKYEEYHRKSDEDE